MESYRSRLELTFLPPSDFLLYVVPISFFLINTVISDRPTKPPDFLLCRSMTLALLKFSGMSPVKFIELEDL